MKQQLLLGQPLLDRGKNLEKISNTTMIPNRWDKALAFLVSCQKGNPVASANIDKFVSTQRA